MAVFVVTAPDGNDYEVTAPEGATEEQALAYAKQQYEAGALTPVAPPAAAASQADVRKAEPQDQPLSPMAALNARVKAFDEAIDRFTAETGGVLKPGQNIRQATTEYTGVADPEPDLALAEIEEVAQGGELQYGNSVPYVASKVLASMGGFAAGGPFGATGAEALVRMSALTSNLKKAIDAGVIDVDRAAEIMAKEMAAGTTEDLAWNTAVPLLGQILKHVPGAKGLIAKVASKIKGGAPAATEEAAQHAAKVAARVDDAATPAGKQAVKELSARMGDHVLTPGQVTGEAGFGERVARAAGESTFAAQEKAAQEAGESLRAATLNPAGQPTREAIGNTIQTMADDAQKAVKARLRPTFQAADASGVKVDFTGVLARAKAALAADAAVPGKRLKPAERSALAELVGDLEKLATPATPAGTVASGLLDAAGRPVMKPTAAVAGTPPVVGAEQALDFISRQKEKLRATVADGKPSQFYDTVMTGLQKQADTAFETAAAGARGPGGRPLVEELRQAQSQYRTMMETVFDDAVKQALKKNPEDVGRLFWQNGNVSEPKQLRRLRALAMGEGALGEGLTATKAAQDQTRSMVRGFLQEGVPNLDTAARWSTMLREKPGLRDTWNTLTAAPGGKELRAAMEVLEEAAKIATRGSAPISVGGVPVKRTIGGGVGVSYVTGALHPGMLATGAALGGLMKLMSTAYAQGNKGMLNMVARTLRAQSAGTAAGAKAAQAAWPVLEEYAAEHGITELLGGKSTEGQPSEPEPQ